jgi:membrane fusion protein (multidrug efflux system)
MRYAFAILILLALIAGLAGIKGAQIAKLVSLGKQAQKAGPPPEAVSSGPALEQDWERTVLATGSVASVRGVAVSNESAGVVTRIHFESGENVEAGKLLVELDTNVERAQLASARARKSLADVNLRRSQALAKSGSIAPSQVDNDRAALDSATADANALSAQIARKAIRAPFKGRLGIRAVNLGQYLSPGTPVTVLESVDAVFVDFTLPQQRLESLASGLPVRVSIAGGPTLDGTISAIDPAVDASTRSVKARASVPNQEQRLRPGMYVNVTVAFPGTSKVVAIPATAVVHAPYGDSVFLVEDRKDASGSTMTGPDGAPAKAARQQFIRLGESRGDFVSVLEGVKPGQEIITAGAFKLRNGAPVMITKDVKPGPELSPHPQNR